MDNPNISVIIPVYNAEKYIRETLDSVLSQSLKEIEVICINDGSTDDSLNILKEYAAHDARIRIIEQENNGAGIARNCGLTAAKGRYIAFMDSDDLYPEQDTLDKLLQAAEKYNCRVVGGYRQVLKQGEICDEKYDKVYNVIMHYPKGCIKKYRDLQTDFNYYCYIYERAMILKENIIFPDYLRFQDPPFFVRAVCAAKEIYLIPHPTYLYRWGHQSIKWTDRKANDLVRGHIDVLNLAKKYKFHNLYEDVVRRLCNRYKDEIILKKISLENIDLYILLVQLSSVEDPATNNISTELMNILIYAEGKLSQLISYKYKNGSGWLCDFLADIKKKYLDINPSGEKALDSSLFRILRGIFKSDTPYQAKLMLREYLMSSQYRALKLQADNVDETQNILDSVDPAFCFVEKLQQSKRNNYRIVHNCSVSKPKFSVIIPVYNVEPYLAECLDSVLNQTLEGIEIICVDDGSTDGSYSLLIEYAKAYPNIKVLQQPNSGLSASRNHGLEEARGEFIHFLDSDDFIEPETYKTLYEVMTTQNLDMLFFNAKSFYETEDLEKRYPWYKTAYSWENNEQGVQSGAEYYVNAILNKTFYTVAWGYSVRRNLLENNKLRFLEGVIHEDNFFTNACILLADRVNHIKMQFYCRRVREGSLTITSKEFRHAYGYYANYRAFERFLLERGFGSNVLSAASVNLSCMIRGGYDAYKNIKNENQRYYYLALPSEESVIFEQLFYKRYELEKKSSQAISRQNRRIKDLKQKFDNTKSELDASKKKLQSSMSRENSLKNSVSFRIGRSITWLPRKIRGGMRCFREHGIVYTLKRVYWHALHFK